MTRRKFYFQLVGITIALLVLIGASQILPVFAPHLNFSLISLGIFFLVAIILFNLGAKSAVSKDKNAFTRIIMASTFIKMFLALIIVVVYHKMANPKGAYFVIPFFVIYFTYTIFETQFLSKLGKIKAH